MEVEPISPQRVRGAVEPPSPANTTTSPSTSAPNLAILAPESPGTRLPAGPRPDRSGPPQPPARSPGPSATSRRGLVKVTTQRGSPPPPPSPGCEACGGPRPNETLLLWGPLRHKLSFAWELHVYGAGALFLLQALVALGSLAGALALRAAARGPVLAAAGLLLGAGLLRAFFLLVDPYGARERLGPRLQLALYNLPFPLLVTALGALVLLGLRGAGPRAPLPPRLQKPALLGALGAAHGSAVLAADLLSPLLSPPINLAVHGLSCAWGCGLALGALLFCRRLRPPEVGPEAALRESGRLRPPGPAPRGLAVGSVLGLLDSGLHLGAALFLYPVLGPTGRFSWPWWVLQFWLRLVELAWAATLSLVALRASCQGGGRADHTCWTKLLRYACPPGKSEVPEPPNNCYDWAAEGAGPDVGRSLIGQPAERGPPRAGPRDPPVAPGRSHSSVGPERASGLSLSELDLRPPSPINLSRSIDEALCREHLVRDSVFLRSSLQFPDSRPGAPRPRRRSDPALGGSLASLSKGSAQISWNPERHGLASPESLPLDELPSTVQLLAAAPGPGEAGDPEREARRSFLALSKQVDSRSDSSETIEL
ncbi:proline-rich transmembrane protein 3 isoform X2 [Tachyglossus aculeatus]|nr:proline-rich transmembrane protein 3 isoform X2 [Tachyglossus aculeatus]